MSSSNYPEPPPPYPLYRSPSTKWEPEIVSVPDLQQSVLTVTSLDAAKSDRIKVDVLRRRNALSNLSQGLKIAHEATGKVIVGDLLWDRCDWADRYAYIQGAWEGIRDALYENPDLDRGPALKRSIRLRMALCHGSRVGLKVHLYHRTASRIRNKAKKQAMESGAEFKEPLDLISSECCNAFCPHCHHRRVLKIYNKLASMCRLADTDTFPGPMTYGDYMVFRIPAEISSSDVSKVFNVTMKRYRLKWMNLFGNNAKRRTARANVVVAARLAPGPVEEWVTIKGRSVPNFYMAIGAVTQYWQTLDLRQGEVSARPVTGTEGRYDHVEFKDGTSEGLPELMKFLDPVVAYDSIYLHPEVVRSMARRFEHIHPIRALSLRRYRWRSFP